MTTDQAETQQNENVEQAGPPLRFGCEVLGGAEIGAPEEQFTRQWVVDQDQWNSMPDRHMEILAQTAGQAHAYASLVILQGSCAWVRTEWVWFADAEAADAEEVSVPE